MQKSGKVPRKVIIVIIIVAVAAMASGYWIYQSYILASRPAWLFKGAYMKYYGEVRLLFATAKGTVYMEVLDLNRTHYKLLKYVKYDTPFGVVENQTVGWYRIDDPEPIKNIVREYETTIYLDTLGITREVIVMESDQGWILYVDKKADIPLKIEFKIDEKNSLILDLIETNVPL